MSLPPFPSGDLGRPIRVVLFGGAFPGRAAPALMAQLGTHPEIEVVGGIYEGPGFSWRTRIRETFRRRGVMAPVALSLQGVQVLGPTLWSPRTARRLRREGASVLARCLSVPDAAAPEVLARVRAWDADLGIVDGSGQPGMTLAGLPRFGTLRTHYGSLPQYRGDKLTFWEVHNGEPTAGIAIQRLEAGIDTGDVLRRGTVAIGNKGLTRVDRELHAVGVEIYLQAILDVKRGTATPTASGTTPNDRRYPQPGLAETLRMLAPWSARGGRR